MATLSEGQFEFNIRGNKIIVNKKDLEIISDSKLWLLANGDKSDTVTVYLNRNVEVFVSILDFLSTQQLHIPNNMCVSKFLKELEFWNVSTEHLSTCCMDKLLEYEEHQEKIEYVKEKLDSMNIANLDTYKALENKGGLRFRIWTFFEDPYSSLGAKLWAMLILLVLIMSIISLVLDSVVELRDTPEWFWEKYQNITENRLFFVYEYTASNAVILCLEILNTCIITFDITIRFCVSPMKCTFLKNPLTIIDILALVPMWLIFILLGATPLKDQAKESFGIVLYILLCMRALRVFRIFRIMDTLRYKGFKLMQISIASSYKALLLLLSVILSAMLIFANIIYFLEISSDKFMSVFVAFWWAIITMTTVGYGDFYPTTIGGYIVGSLCALTGILAVAMPIPIVVGNFTEYYNIGSLLSRRKEEEKKKEKIKALKNSQSIKPFLKTNKVEVVSLDPVST